MDEAGSTRQTVIERFFGTCGRKTLGLAGRLVFLYHLILDSLYWTFAAPVMGKGLRVGSTFDEMVKVGVNAVPIVALISFSIGMILAMQSAYQLEQFGA
ncbi:MAG TPA: ABC transporter permease, partial [Candidatus Glassbacteria bacterium]|nr:ABC transporter permease [Candidatus Glassbacteria bacterium]